MYSTCLFCHADLGRNDAIEHFPVGRRLAFDAAKGRLWVVCARCRNWNLTPLEERWEAVEECERAFRSTRLRTSTDNIGLARLGAGVDLVRIGSSLRPEFAAWRYGTRLRSRRLRAAGATAGGVVVGGAALAVGGAAMLATFTFLGALTFPVAKAGVDWLDEHFVEYIRYERVIARIRPPDGDLRDVRVKDLRRLELVPASTEAGWSLRVGHRTGTTDLVGSTAVQAAGQLLARINRHGGSGAGVRDAARRIADAGDATRFIHQAIRVRDARRRTGELFSNDQVGLLGLTPPERLALEMAVHEDSERQALQGQLAALEVAWRDAEEVAGIADDLTLPDSVRQLLDRLRSRARGQGGPGA